MNNYERIRVALDLLRDDLDGYVSTRIGDQSLYAFAQGREAQKNADVQVLVNTMINNWDSVFCHHLESDVRHFVHQVRKTRNRFAHQEKFDDSDTYTSLHEIQRLMESVASNQVGQIELMKSELVKEMTAKGANAEIAARLEGEVDNVGSLIRHQMARLTLLQSGRPTSRKFEFDLPVMIGRNFETEYESAVDLSEIDGSEYVSRRHARMSYEPDGCWLEDLGSSNGTYHLKDDFLRIERAQINHGDQIAFGNARFLFELIESNEDNVR